MSGAEDGSIPVPDMSALIARLEAAEAGSRELDAALWYALFEPDVDYPGIHTEQTEQGPREVLTCELGSKWADDVGPYTTSLDAALALAERVVGDREWMVEGKDRPLGRVHRACLGIVGPVYASTPALALCIAILKAKAWLKARKDYLRKFDDSAPAPLSDGWARDPKTGRPVIQ